MIQILILSLMFLFAQTVHGQETTPAYILELEQVDASPEAKIQTLPAAFQRELQEKGFIVSSGSKKNALILKISDTNVDFSDIISARQKTNSTLLSVNGSDGYEIIAFLKEPFHTSLDEQIPQTSCNDSSPCSENNSNTWTDTESYGWGYHLSGPDVVYTFKDEDNFRIFDTEKRTLFSQFEGTADERSTKLTIKLQVPPEQKEGNYTGVIKIITIPKL